MSFIGGQIAVYRKKLHMSQEELAFRAQIDPQTLQEIEEGHLIPGPDTLLKISIILDMPFCFYDGIDRDRPLFH